MATAVRALILIAALAVAGGAACREQSPGGRAGSLSLERTIPLKGVAGRIDHMTFDLAHGRLFVAELGNGSVESVDLAHGVSLGRISGLKEPQGVVYLRARDEIAVASGGDGTVRFYRARDLASLATVDVGDDADNMRVDGRGRVVVGYGSGGLAVIDPASRKVLTRLTLPAHPESFQIDGDRVLVNAPGARRILAGDFAQGRVTASWTTAYGGNFPMAMGADGRSIAVVFRSPARLQMLDAASGAVKVDRATCGDADDVFFDARRARLYVTCGAGAVDLIELGGTVSSATIETRPGARTGLFIPELDRLVVAAPARGGEAALLIYRPRS